MFGPNQVGEIMIGNAVATETTAQAFVASADNKELKVVSGNGAAVAANVPFKVLQKTAGDAGKGLNYEFSDIVDPKFVEKVTLATYAAEVQKQVTIAGFTGNVLANTTYEVEVRLYNDGGSLSPENFAVIQGFYVTGATIAAETATTIRDGLLNSLRKNLIKRGDSEFVTATTAAPGFTIAGKFQNVVPGKIEGRQIEFDVTVKVFQNVQDLTQPNQNLGLLTAVVNTVNNTGNGTGKYVVNYEWFVKGMKYDPARQVGYPADFNTPYYGSLTGVYNLINIKYYTPRVETLVERQYKSLTIAIDKVTNTLANNAATNAILTSIRTAVGTNAIVPANLAVV
jgi:hypothetical protein